MAYYHDKFARTKGQREGAWEGNKAWQAMEANVEEN